MSEISIWIGDVLPSLVDLNTLNLNDYLYRGGIVIGYEAKSRLIKHGGTLLKYSSKTGLHFVSFKVSGKGNHTSMKSEYLLADLSFSGAIVNRISYTPEIIETGFYCRRIQLPKVTYMCTGGFELSEKDISTINQIMIEKVQFTNEFLKLYPKPTDTSFEDKLAVGEELTQAEQENKERQDKHNQMIRALEITSAALGVQSAALTTLRSLD